jgi:hypothetical protein
VGNGPGYYYSVNNLASNTRLEKQGKLIQCFVLRAKEQELLFSVVVNTEGVILCVCVNTWDVKYTSFEADLFGVSFKHR